MNELVAGRIKRALKRLGVVVYRSSHQRFTYDKENFPKARMNGVVFDVGANIGQSAIWLSETLDSPQIHAFEPLGSVYETLQHNTQKYKNIQTIHRAMGETEAVIEIPKVLSKDTQVIAVLGSFEQSNDSTDKERIVVTTVDNYAAENDINHIDILKTDTEGHDMDVAKGAERMLSEGNISYFISEVTIKSGDTGHTQFDDLRDFMKRFGYEATSFLDLKYRLNGRLNYFNVLFEKP